MKVYLSPSTQEANIGVGNYGTEEVYCNLIADRVNEALSKYAIEIMQNTPDMMLGEIVTASNMFAPDLHVAIHTNASGAAINNSAKGCMVFCHKFGGVGHVAAKMIYTRLSELTPWSDQGVKEGYNWYGEGKHLYELAHTLAPAVLIEIDFHDNIESAKFLLENKDAIAKQIVNGILCSIGVMPIAEVSLEKMLQEANESLEMIRQYSTKITALTGG